jgi:hypothetical protein
MILTLEFNFKTTITKKQKLYKQLIHPEESEKK